VPAINKYWRKRKDGVILGIYLEEYLFEKWVELGIDLVGALLSLGEFYGLYASGDLPMEVLLSWTRAVSGTHAEGVADMRWMARPDALRRWNDKSTRWSVVQRVDDADWLKRVWTDMGSSRFHVDTFLILAVYDTNVSTELHWEKAVTIDSFGRTLSRALGWIMPIDENIGFIVGIPVRSQLYDRFVATG
jgi:hypothetical protein